MRYPVAGRSLSRWSGITCLGVLLIMLASACSLDERRKAAERDELSRAWMQLLDVSPTDLTVMPAADGTGLQVNSNFEMRELSRYLIPAWMAVAGQAPDVLETWVLYPYLSQEDPLGFMRESARTDEELRALGRQLRTDRILQVELGKNDGQITANAWLLDVRSGERQGEWTASVDIGKDPYQAVFEAQAELAPTVAADLLGMERADLLDPGDISTRLSAEEREHIESVIAEAAALISPMTTARIFEAYHLVIEALETDPRNPELWILYTAINRQLGYLTEEYGPEIRREAVIRMILGGKIAIALAPEDPRARFAYGQNRWGSGRGGALLDFARDQAAEYPDSWLDRLLYQCAHWEDTTELEPPPGDLDPVSQHFADIYYGFSRYIKGEAYAFDVVGRWLLEDAFAGDMLRQWMHWGGTAGETGYWEDMTSSHLRAMQGSMLTIMEASHQLARHGHEEEARELLKRIYDLTGGEIPEVEGHELFRETRRHLSEWFDGRDAQRELERSYELRPASPAWELLIASREGRHRVVELIGRDVGQPGPLGHAVAYTPWQAMELAHRTAVDGALSTYRYYHGISRTSDPTRSILSRMEEEFPSDIGVLLERLLHQRYDLRNSDQVKATRDRILDITPTNLQYHKAALSWQSGPREEALEDIRRIERLEPFQVRSLLYLLMELSERGFHSEAHELASRAHDRAPLQGSLSYSSALHGALAEGRGLRVEEIAALEEHLEPFNQRRQRFLAGYYTSHGYYDEALAQLEKLRDEKGELSYGDTISTVDILRRKGEFGRAIALLEEYAEDPQTFHSGASALVDIHDIHLLLGDTEKAREYLFKAQQMDSTNYPFMYSWVAWSLREGLPDRAERTLRVGANIYTYAPIHLSYTLFLMNQGRSDAARRQLDQAYHMAPADERVLYTYMLYLLREGRHGDLEQMLAGKDGEFLHDPLVPYHQSTYHWLMGDSDRSVEYAKEALSRARGVPRRWSSHEPPRRSARAALATLHIQRGELDEASEHLAPLLLAEPSYAPLQALHGWLLLEKGELDEAEEALQEAYNLNNQSARNVMARIRFLRGQEEEALEIMRATNRLYLPLVSAYWLYGEGEMAKELGRDDMAREAWELIVNTFGDEHHNIGKKAREALDELDS